MKRLHHLTLIWLLIVLIVPGNLIPQPAARAAIPSRDPRFGVVESFRDPQRASELGASWTRILFWWNALEPAQNSDFSFHYLSDEILQREINDGRTVAGLIIQTALWASSSTVNAPPRNLDLPYNHPDNYWGSFVHRLATKYKNRIDTWIIWNEPDIWDSSNPQHTWTGTPEQFYQLQKVAYLAIKAANPGAQVTLPGLTYWWDAQYGRKQFLERYLELASADPSARANNWYFDAAVLQIYSDPKMLYDGPHIFREIMTKYGIKKPIWINETNVTPWDDPDGPLGRGAYRSTLDEQASCIIQAMAYAVVAGVERVAMFKMRDDFPLPGNESYGLVREDGSLRPAYHAYATAIRYFSGVQSGSISRSGNITRIVLEKEKERITVLWLNSLNGTNARIWAISPSAQLVDKFGNISTLYANQGMFSVLLGGATAHNVPGEPLRSFIGGTPVILVEAKHAQPGLQNMPGTSSTHHWTAPETGYTVSGKWLEFYQRNGGLDNLGLPRSNVVSDPFTRQTVQYFQRAILEWHPQNPEPYKIQRRLLVDLMLPASDPPVSSESHSHLPAGSWRYYPQSSGGTPTGLGHFVSNYTTDRKAIYFLEFFDSHGGVEVLGFPKEEPKLRDGLWTQRFQAGILEYHPEYDRDGTIPGTTLPYRNYRVMLRLLGDEFMRQYGLLYE